MERESEWGRFRASLADALVHPRRFAGTLGREHYGLAGVVVAFAAGIALSVTVDVAVILSKAADPVALVPRLLADAFLLAVRFLIATALVALLTVAVGRLAGRSMTIDQAFTALSFATSPLLFAPLVVTLMVVALEAGKPAREPLLAIALAVAVLILLRLAAGVALNITALAGRAALVVSAAALVTAALVMQDQVGRITFTTLTYAPQALPTPAAGAPDGADLAIDGLRLRVPADWKEASRGVPGVVAQYELPDARLTVRTKSVSVLTTTDAFAASQVDSLLRDFTRVDRAARGLVRLDSAVAIDDRWVGRIDGQRLVQRMYSVVIGRRGYLLEFQFFSPVDEDAALQRAASIAASVRVSP